MVDIYTMMNTMLRKPQVLTIQVVHSMMGQQLNQIHRIGISVS